mmetsp:Transcript_2420/g.5614  ORF Transcript_2420/g.5614 Transcript_2420/m.5614 type:complete len:153 (-) Transcript_2420:78-536(-)
MSLLTAVARGARAAQRAQPAMLVARRSLGDSVSGPPVTDLAANFKLATQLFTKNPVSYQEFRQQCASLRIFVFAALNVGLVTALFLDPPKSSYWVRMSPLYIFSFLKSSFYSSAPPIFLTQKVENEADVPSIFVELTTTRRLASAGSDSEDE